MQLVHQHGKRMGGFTFVELAIAMVVTGILIAGALSAGEVLLRKERLSATQNSMETVRSAIATYMKTNGRYPCPAPLEADIDTPTFGRATDCTDTTTALGSCAETAGRRDYCIVEGRAAKRVRVGAVPTRSLEINDAHMFDAYGARFYYAVTEDLARDFASYTATGGAISIVDSNGNDLTAVPGSAHMVIVSGGADTRGMVGRFGIPSANECDGDADVSIDIENCDLENAIFRNSVHMSEGATRFDDFLVFASMDDRSIAEELEDIRTCNAIGKLYAPDDPGADANGCISPATPAATPPDINFECHNVSTGWVTMSYGATYTAPSCNPGYTGVDCHMDYYDTNGGVIYHGYAGGTWHASRTSCRGTVGDMGITEGAVRGTCCRAIYE